VTTLASTAELERIMGSDRMSSPTASPEWDEWRTWPARDRNRLKRFLGGGALTPDELATELGCSCDEALRTWRDACFVALDAGRSDRVDAWEWEMAEAAAVLAEIIGPHEVAEMLEVSVGTVHQWRKRDAIIAPSRIVSGVPLWTRAEILGWALETRRIVPEIVEKF